MRPGLITLPRKMLEILLIKLLPRNSFLIVGNLYLVIIIPYRIISQPRIFCVKLMKHLTLFRLTLGLSLVMTLHSSLNGSMTQKIRKKQNSTVSLFLNRRLLSQPRKFRKVQIMTKQTNLFDMSLERLPWQFTRKSKRTITVLDVIVRTDRPPVRKTKIESEEKN